MLFYANSQVCTEFLGTDLSTGKELLSSVMGGSALTPPWDKNAFLPEVQKLARYMRWVACSLLPDVYQTCCTHEQRSYPEASTFFFMWSAIEDFILSAWLEATTQYTIRHLSLHYDGIRLDADLPDGADAYCRAVQDRIYEQTGFRVTIREKVHRTFLEFVAAKAISSRSVADLDPVFEQPGNCIPCALSHLMPNAAGLLDHFKDAKDICNVVASNRRVRTYNEVQRLSGTIMHPSYGFHMHTEGLYLIHMENDGCPHCVAAKFSGQHVEVYDGKMCWTSCLRTLRECAASSIDKSTMVTFRVYTSTAQSPALPDQPFPTAVDTLMSLQAGGRTSSMRAPVCDFDDSDEDVNMESGESSQEEVLEEDAEQFNDDEAIVHVGDELLRALKVEVANVSKRYGVRTRRQTNAQYDCPLCPFRAFPRRQKLTAHLSRHHCARRQYVCSGTKQMRVIIALWDDDQTAGRRSDDYLARSATLIANSVQPKLTHHQNFIDKKIRLVLTGAGPVYYNLQIVDESRDLRRVGNIYYNHEFAEMLKTEALVHHCKVRSLLTRLTMSARSKGCQLTTLFPTRAETWWGLVEDVFTSSAVKLLSASYMDAMIENEEMECLSIDTTMKIAMTLMGQAHWRADHSTKQKAVVPEVESIRRVLTVRGRTGGVITMTSYKQDDNTDTERICSCLTAALPLRARQLVRFVSSDLASGLLWRSLQGIFPNLEALCLDPVHLPIVYEYSTWKKRSPGSRFLRMIMNKFNKRDSTLDPAIWGDVQTGDDAKDGEMTDDTHTHTHDPYEIMKSDDGQSRTPYGKTMISSHTYQTV